MHSCIHAFLMHPRSPGSDTFPENRCWQMADHKNSQCSSPFKGQSSQNFPHL